MVNLSYNYPKYIIKKKQNSIKLGYKHTHSL